MASNPSLFYDPLRSAFDAPASREEVAALRAEVAALRDDVMSLAEAMDLVSDWLAEIQRVIGLNDVPSVARARAEAISEKHGREL